MLLATAMALRVGIKGFNRGGVAPSITGRQRYASGRTSNEKEARWARRLGSAAREARQATTAWYRRSDGNGFEGSAGKRESP